LLLRKHTFSLQVVPICGDSFLFKNKIMGLTILILFGSIALIIFILIYTAKAEGRKRRRAFEQGVHEAAAQHLLKWTYVDIDRHRAMAWSADKRILFFMDFAEANGNKQLMEMDHVKTCEIINHYSPGSNKKGNTTETNISIIELQLVYENKDPVSLQMYNELTDGVFEKIRLAEKVRNLRSMITIKQ
jgi:hypothetical protein